jgi:glutathione S-transferase
MKLYHAPGACSLADHIALVASGLPFDTERVDLKSKVTQSGGDYRKINPKGYVPALELDDGQVLTENIAILSFIADKSGTLSPGGMDRWRVLEMLAFVSTELHKNFKPFFSPDATEQDKAKARETLSARFALVDQQLGGRHHIVGEGLTGADCYLFVMLMWASQKAGLQLPQGLAAYQDRMRQEPAVAKALRDEGIDKS